MKTAIVVIGFVCSLSFLLTIIATWREYPLYRNVGSLLMCFGSLLTLAYWWNTWRLQ